MQPASRIPAKPKLLASKQPIPCLPEQVDRAPALDHLKANTKADDRPNPRPRGLHNFHRGCFANAVVQCLAEILDLAGRLRTKSAGILQNTELRSTTEANLLKMAGRKRVAEAKRQLIEAAFEDLKEKV